MLERRDGDETDAVMRAGNENGRSPEGGLNRGEGQKIDSMNPEDCKEWDCGNCLEGKLFVLTASNGVPTSCKQGEEKNAFSEDCCEGRKGGEGIYRWTAYQVRRTEDVGVVKRRGYEMVGRR